MAAPVPDVNLDATLGVAFVGLAVTLFVYSLNLAQLVVYFRTSSQDSRAFKFVIFGLWILDTAHVALIVVGLWHFVLVLRGDLSSILQPAWPFAAQVYAMAISNLVVRDAFAYRIWHLSGQRSFIPVVIVSLSLYTAAMSGIYATEGVYSMSWITGRIREWAVFSGYGTEMLGDSIIAVAMTRLLISFRTGFQRSDSIVQTFIMYSVNTGALTILCTASSLISVRCAIGCYPLYRLLSILTPQSIAIPRSFAFLAIYFVVGKLYLNSLLGTLNARMRLRLPEQGTAPLLTTEVGIQFSGTEASDSDDSEPIMGQVPNLAAPFAALAHARRPPDPDIQEVREMDGASTYAHAE
ncbi:hypothetical protein OBBRIDRAFT_785214 [Obba rivulosa]|uniref:DUF6534 domain-containing protein n=1 Tax=Obba rivulosa TaxID=1052685 RepID=A0A8E2DES6_9APHY|nr:hypothetical protein OBBRIDRAFT_785214 [Obba rivulosa]